LVIAGFIPAIHVFAKSSAEKTWMARASPAMTKENDLVDSNALTAPNKTASPA